MREADQGKSVLPYSRESSPITNEAEVSMVQDVRIEAANAVTTRAQKVKEASTHVPVFDQSNISVANCRNTQKHGASLQCVRNPTRQWFGLTVRGFSGISNTTTQGTSVENLCRIRVEVR